ncbi:MAG TPA: endonuclease, partial [Spirochaetia bacterium]|nr:endonuclease [Spirochaetia bacterium]
ERFEIAVGAILTQNTAWENARRALAALRERGLLGVQAVQGVEVAELAPLILSSGYYNQKARKIRNLAGAWSEICQATGAELRGTLLAVWGIGPETADSIALYAFHLPNFIVDGYALRTFRRIGLFGPGEGYETIRSVVEGSLNWNSELLGELHALLVRLGQEHCRARPECDGCPLRGVCATGMNRT